MKNSFKQEAPLRFHRWSRKGFAIFSSLRKVVTIATLSIATTIISQPCKAQHKPDTSAISRILETDSVVITAQRSPVVASKLTRPVQVITSADIERAPAQTLDGLLEQIPGVDVRTRGGYGIQSDVSVRGGTFDQTLVLLNGIPMSDPQTGHHAMNLPVDADAIEKVEVLTGPAARVFGANAYNGVINAITKSGCSDGVILRIEGGQNGLYQTNGTATFNARSTENLISVAKSGSDGYIPNTDFQSAKVFIQNKINLNILDIESQAGWSLRDFGANAFYSPRFPNQFEHTQTFNASIKASTKGKVKLSPSFYWRRNYDRFELFRSDAPEWYTSHNYHRSEVRGASLNTFLAWSGGKTSLGAEYRLESIVSNILGTPLSIPEPVNGEDGIFYKNGDQRELFSVFAEHTLYLRRLTINAGFLGIAVPSKDIGFKIYPGIEAGYEISNRLHLSLAYNQTLRLPTFTDLYYTSPTNIANPLLKPEEAHVWEGGLRFKYHFFNIIGNTFYRAGRNMIDWVQVDGEEKWRSMNLTEVDLYGTEIQIKYQQPATTTKGLIQGQISWQYTQSEKESTGYLSKYALDNLKHKVDIVTHWLLPAGFTLNIRASYQVRDGSYLKWPDNTPTAYKPQWVTDARLAWSRGKLSVYADATNLFNADYTDHANLPQPGRWLKAGIVYRSDN
ncbi:MAG: TonB-dependent receptor [Bacteroidales bacterium]|nr:TonB-dependent receptor [Bacteroidales bacterium]MDD3666178.1 TonB-dependent receptor [Bacteroidales bacterium]